MLIMKTKDMGDGGVVYEVSYGVVIPMWYIYSKGIDHPEGAQHKQGRDKINDIILNGTMH